MRWWAGKHLGGVAFVPPHGKPRLSYCVKYCELTALVAVRLDCASFCRLCGRQGIVLVKDTRLFSRGWLWDSVLPSCEYFIDHVQ